MTNFKITNKETKAFQYMNGKETANFVFKNEPSNYTIEDMTNKISNTRFYLCSISLILLCVCSFLLHLQLNY